MKRTLIRLAKRLLKRLGIVAFKRSTGIYVPEDESYRIVAGLASRSNPVVIDGGAHLGDMVDNFNALLPNAEFHCFEPDPVIAEQLAKKFSSQRNVHVVRSALGAAAGRATFNINASRPTNSLLPTVANLNADLESLCRPVEQVEVAVTTIDEYCAGCELRRVDIVKLDLQGYDFLALTGAKATLEKTDVVLVEVWFQEVYRGSARFPQILALMIESGFELYTLCGLHYGVNDELIWADAIFFRPDSTTPGRIPSPRF